MNLASILIQIPTLIRALEDVLPEPNQGAQKLEAIKTAIGSTVTDSEMPEFLAKAWPKIERYINILVMLFNVLAVFKK